MSAMVAQVELVELQVALADSTGVMVLPNVVSLDLSIQLSHTALTHHLDKLSQTGGGCPPVAAL